MRRLLITSGPVEEFVGRLEEAGALAAYPRFPTESALLAGCALAPYPGFMEEISGGAG